LYISICNFVKNYFLPLQGSKEERGGADASVEQSGGGEQGK
jgi:hypothetical protein